MQERKPEVKAIKAYIQTLIATIPEPRAGKNLKFPREFLILCLLFSHIAEPDGWYAKADYCEDHFHEIVAIYNDLGYTKQIKAAPSHDTLNRFSIIITLDAYVEFQCNFIESIEKGQIIVDGKLMRTIQKMSPNSKAYTVNVYSVEHNMCFQQGFCNRKKGELATALELLNPMNIKGKIVTADALYCQTRVMQIIGDKEADYCIQLKMNQKRACAKAEKLLDDPNLVGDNIIKIEEDRDGQKILRTYRFVTNVNELKDAKELKRFPYLKTIIAEEKLVADKGSNYKLSEQKRYFLTSSDNIDELPTNIRNHWYIENKLHYNLDVLMREDSCRSRKGNAPKNINILNKICLFIINKAAEVFDRPLKRAKATITRLSPIQLYNAV